jgi:hypothetical protein
MVDDDKAMTIRFEPRDVWIGWFWDRRDDGTHRYVCIVPMVVIHWVVRPKWVRRIGPIDGTLYVPQTDPRLTARHDGGT